MSLILQEVITIFGFNVLAVVASQTAPFGVLQGCKRGQLGLGHCDPTDKYACDI